MTTELTRRNFVIALMSAGAGVAFLPSSVFAKDGDDDDDDSDSDDNSGSGSSNSGSDDDDDDDNESSSSGGSSSSNSDDDDDDDKEDDQSSSGGQGSSRGSKSGSAGRNQNDSKNAARAVEAGKAVSMRKLMSHIKSNYGGKVLDVKLNRGIFRYTYRVKHLGQNGRLQTLKLDALSLKKL